MKALLALAACCLALPAAAQTSLLTASPIPEGAESKFCYYAGMAYSPKSVIIIGGNNERAQSVSGGALNSGGQVRVQETGKAFECMASGDGVMQWNSIATLQLGD